MKRFNLKFICAFFAGLVLISACSDDDEGANPTAPQLPPEESMSANMGGFPSNEESGSTAAFEGGLSNFGFAAANVFFWQTIINVQLAIPVASFKEAFNHSFEYLEDQGRWKSDYTVKVGNKTIIATLYSERNDDQVDWEMYLSSEGEFEDFLWFSGESAVDKSGGNWILYKSPSESRPLLQINWERENGAIVNSTYTLIDTEADRTGSYIEYGVSTESGFTHYYEISITSNSEDDYDATIYYNQNSRIGSVRSQSYFGDPDFRCWNESLDDSTCEN